VRFHFERFNEARPAAGIVAATDSASAAVPVTETDVTIKTSDGTCDAAFIHPTSGSHPAVIVWSDAFGLRPAMRDIGKRIAAEGYSVLVPNPFYRVKPGPAVDDIASFNFQTDMPKIQPLMASINAPGNCEKDAARTQLAQFPHSDYRNVGIRIVRRASFSVPRNIYVCARRLERRGSPFIPK
jgi:hypothetical protein